MDLTREVPVFDRRSPAGEQPFTRIGGGSLGGKGAGLWFIHDRLLPELDAGAFAGFDIAVPSLTVVASGVYSTFVERNGLESLIEDPPSDARLAHAFLRGELPAEFAGDLRGLIRRVHRPLAVRSSSRLEDALDHPFAGMYATKMIPNGEFDEDARFRRLEEAIKLVWASTCFSDARAYRRAAGVEDAGEAMAVVVQEVVGQRAGDRFYPCVSGVARSFNNYPTGHGRGEDGVVSLALGLGKTIVDGGRSWTYCPAYPKAPPPFNSIRDLLGATQTRFWAVHMGEPPLPDPLRETECMVEVELAAAEADGALGPLVSTYDAASDRLDPGCSGSGPRALTFAPLIGSRLIPFNDLLRHVMDRMRQALDAHVEVEFALRLHRQDIYPARLGLLQVRPMRGLEATETVEQDELRAPGVVVASELTLGNGSVDDIEDIVFLPPDRFDQSETHRMAAELTGINNRLVAEGRRYLLIGFGRWGTSDAWLGVPVTWGQISGAAVIVEATLPGVSPDMSQGSHFFHNVLGNRVLYLSVPHQGPHPIDWDWLGRQPVMTATDHVVHARCERPIRVRVDGVNRRGLVE
jgi:hypothetical protein